MARPAEKLEKELARFTDKGPRIKVLEHARFDRNGNVIEEGKFDIMEKEFAPYNLTGASENFQTDTHAESCAQLRGSEAEFFEKGKEARDGRLVILKSGLVAQAVGSLADGSGYLLDSNGRPINRSVNPPVTPMKRKANDW